MRSQIDYSDAFELVKAMYTWMNCMELFDIVDPDKVMTPKERSEAWDAYRKDYVKYFKSLPFGTREAVIARMNELIKDSWSKCSTNYQKISPLRPMTDINVYRGIEGMIVLDKLIDQVPSLTFLLPMGISRAAVDEFVEKLDGYESNRGYHLLCMMDNNCKFILINQLAIC